MYLPLNMLCCSMSRGKRTMSIIYGDNVWHHSQSFRIMVNGWKWDPHIWYDLLYNWPTHKLSCKYLHVDQSHDGMHMLPHWTTLYCDAWKTCKDLSFLGWPFLKFLMTANTRTRWYILTWVMILHRWSPIHKMACKYSNVDQSHSNFNF